MPASGGDSQAGFRDISHWTGHSQTGVPPPNERVAGRAPGKFAARRLRRPQVDTLVKALRKCFWAWRAEENRTRLPFGRDDQASATTTNYLCGDWAADGWPKFYKAFMFCRNSELLRALPSLSTSNSIASTGDSGLSTLRTSQVRCSSSFGISSSSFRVPER